MTTVNVLPSSDNKVVAPRLPDMIKSKKSKKTNPLAKKDEITATAKQEKTPYEIVVMGEAAKRFKKNMWEQMVGQATKVQVSMPAASANGQRAQFEQVMLKGEEEYMHTYHGADMKAKDGNGNWKFRAYLPASYRTAKSVAANCIEQGTPMVEHGKVRGKSACEGDYRQEVADKVAPKTPYQKAKIVIETLDKLVCGMSVTEREAIGVELAKRGKAMSPATK
jgi:hypothetical protein